MIIKVDFMKQMKKNILIKIKEERLLSILFTQNFHKYNGMSLRVWAHTVLKASLLSIT